jgi:hypothetical protein
MKIWTCLLEFSGMSENEAAISGDTVFCNHRPVRGRETVAHRWPQVVGIATLQELAHIWLTLSEPFIHLT